MQNLEPVNLHCPYCGEPIEMLIDCSVDIQRYIEDCQVCCRPIDVVVSVATGDGPRVTLSHENEV